MGNIFELITSLSLQVGMTQLCASIVEGLYVTG